VGVLASGLVACGAGTPLPQGDDTGEVIAGVPNIVIREVNLDFGTVALNAIVSDHLVVENTGTGTLTIGAIDAIEPYTTSFSSAISVAAGSTAQVTVRFEPTAYGEYESELTFSSDDPDTPIYVFPVMGMVATDADEDGYDAETAGGEDCEDDDDAIYPGAQEIWYDDIDQDCDGESDYDQDGDGFEWDYYNDDSSSGGGDCQDANDAVYPGQEDTWYDNIDSDCDGQNDWDADG
jgi:hypothetical protein